MSKTGRPKGPSGPHKSPRLTEQQVNEIEALYKAGDLSEKQIGSLYQKSGTCIRLNMQKRGISRVFDTRGYVVNDGVFSESWTEEHSYWLGMLHADGHCSTSGYSISLELKTEDEATVKGFAKFVGFSGEVKYQPPHDFVSPNKKTYTSSGTWRLRFSSKQIHADLTERGIITKDKRIWMPPIGLRDYMRGMFDGNGSIIKGKKAGSWNWYYTGSLSTCEFFKSIWEGIGIACFLREGTGCWQLRIKSTEGSMKAQRYMYEGCTGPMMARKAIFETSEHLWSESGRKIPTSYGTQYEEDKKRFRATVYVDNKRVRLGRFRTRGLAYSAYAKDSLRRHGKRSPFWRNLGATPAVVNSVIVKQQPPQPTPTTVVVPATPSWAAKLEQQRLAIENRPKTKTSFGLERQE